MKIDSEASTHEMSRYIDNPKDIMKVYDHIVYAKGKIRFLLGFLMLKII